MSHDPLTIDNRLIIGWYLVFSRINSDSHAPAPFTTILTLPISFLEISTYQIMFYYRDKRSTKEKQHYVTNNASI